MLNKILLSVLASIFLDASICFASFTVEWGYTPPSSPSVIGYRLYKGSVKVVEFVGSTNVSGIVNLPIVNGDQFTLTAYFSDGTESPKSAVFTYLSAFKPQSVPSITNIIIL